MKRYYVSFSFRDDFLNLHVASFYDFPFKEITSGILEDFLQAVEEAAMNNDPLNEFRVISWQEIKVD